ncbi:MAG TPA: NADP-dependent oxidoreductase [Hellea balneolensis]|uniref:NADP-dependent oxidoreductase n=1 Tax=Hellea balneolensis TaxID=287478 RepID=A0A7C5QX27_9PROT|nr:NADP-dependent oxidoreductase [Hellea balneolensis]
MQQIVLKHSLVNKPVATDFISIDKPVPECPKDGILVKVLYISLDPYVGSRLRGRHMGEPAPTPKTGLVPGAVVGKVLESQAKNIILGDYVYSVEGGWAETVALPAGSFRKIDPKLAPLNTYLGALGLPGLTAWAGVTKLIDIRDGDVFMVNAASGAVGGMAGQIARLKGAKTLIGIAGGAEKWAIVTGEYGFDYCLNYKADGWQDELKTIVPNGINIHFENVSDTMLAFALDHMQLYGRAILCGLAAHYHADGPPASVTLGRLIAKRASLHGLVVYDFYDRWDEFIAEIGPHVGNGEIKIHEHMEQGLVSAPALMEKLVNGRNHGKCVIKVSED